MARLGLDVFRLAQHEPATRPDRHEPLLRGHAPDRLRGAFPRFATGFVLDQTAQAALSITVLLSFTMMLSQAMESVTRAFYARDDLDLILSSPAPSRDLFLVRIVMMALTSWAMSALVISPFLNVAVVLGGEHWLAGYVVLLAVSLNATGAGVLITLALFRTVGAQRTRFTRKFWQRSLARPSSSGCRWWRSCPSGRCRGSRCSIPPSWQAMRRAKARRGGSSPTR